MRKSFLLCLFSILTAPIYPQIAPDASGRRYAKILGFELGKVTYQNLFTKLGSAALYSSGDASESEKRVHYYLKSEDVYLTFNSGEIDGDHIVSGLKLCRTRPKERFTANVTLKLMKEDIGGIRLGMSREQFLKFFPASVIWDLWIEFENVIPMTRKEIEQQHSTDPRYQAWTEIISITPVFRNGKLVEIAITKTTQY